MQFGQFVAALALVAFVLGSCSVRQDVIARVRSPDGLVDAVHTQPETGATDGFVDQVYLVAAGGDVNGAPVFVGDRITPRLSMTWTGPSQITVSADGGRVFRAEPNLDVNGGGGAKRAIAIRVRIAKLNR